MHPFEHAPPGVDQGSRSAKAVPGASARMLVGHADAATLVPATTARALNTALGIAGAPAQCLGVWTRA